MQIMCNGLVRRGGNTWSEKGNRSICYIRDFDNWAATVNLGAAELSTLSRHAFGAKDRDCTCVRQLLSIL